MYNPIEEIKTELKNSIKDNETKLKSWINVTFPTKKNGQPFATMSKNIQGADYRIEKYSIQSSYELCIRYIDKNSRIKEDVIKCTELIKYLTDSDKIAKKQNYLPKQPYLEQLYNYDLDDIKKAVILRIEDLKARTNDLEHELKLVELAYTQFKKDIETAYDNLTVNSGANLYNNGFSEKRNSLYYAIKKEVLR